MSFKRLSLTALVFALGCSVSPKHNDITKDNFFYDPKTSDDSSYVSIIYSNTARMYEDLRDKGISTYADSIEVYYQKALEFNPENTEALAGLSFHYSTSNSLEEKIISLELAKNLVKIEETSRSYYVLAAAYYSLGNYKEEDKAVNKAKLLESK